MLSAQEGDARACLADRGGYRLWSGRRADRAERRAKAACERAADGLAAGSQAGSRCWSRPEPRDAACRRVPGTHRAPRRPAPTSPSAEPRARRRRSRCGSRSPAGTSHAEPRRLSSSLTPRRSGPGWRLAMAAAGRSRSGAGRARASRPRSSCTPARHRGARTAAPRYSKFSRRSPPPRLRPPRHPRSAPRGATGLPRRLAPVSLTAEATAASLATATSSSVSVLSGALNRSVYASDLRPGPTCSPV